MMPQSSQGRVGSQSANMVHTRSALTLTPDERRLTQKIKESLGIKQHARTRSRTSLVRGCFSLIQKNTSHRQESILSGLGAKYLRKYVSGKIFESKYQEQGFKLGQEWLVVGQQYFSRNGASFDAGNTFGQYFLVSLCTFSVYSIIIHYLAIYEVANASLSKLFQTIDRGICLTAKYV
jgi:hypothetical protein